MKKILKGLRHPEMVLRWLRQSIKLNLALPLWFRRIVGALLPPYRHSRFRSLYVLTYGRSGSTLLTGYLSMLPGIDLRGENYLYMLPFAESDERIWQLSKLRYSDRHKTSSPWYGSQQSSYPRYRRHLRKLLLDQLYPLRPIPKTVGFKEIRWWYRLSPERFERDLNWLLDLFPRGGVVLLTRDLEKVFAGAWWAEMSDAERSNAEVQLRQFEQLAKEYVAKYPERGFHVTYEGFTADQEMARGLTEFLGLPFRERVWRKALGTRFSYPSQRPQTAETNSD